MLLLLFLEMCVTILVCSLCIQFLYWQTHKNTYSRLKRNETTIFYLFKKPRSHIGKWFSFPTFFKKCVNSRKTESTKLKMLMKCVHQRWGCHSQLNAIYSIQSLTIILLILWINIFNRKITPLYPIEYKVLNIAASSHIFWSHSVGLYVYESDVFRSSFKNKSTFFFYQQVTIETHCFCFSIQSYLYLILYKISEMLSAYEASFDLHQSRKNIGFCIHFFFLWYFFFFCFFVCVQN